MQFQSLSANPRNPSRRSSAARRTTGRGRYTRSTRRWFEIVGGDGGQSGFDPRPRAIRYHNYFDATPEVNFHGDDPRTWLRQLRPAAADRRGALVLHAVRGGPETPGRLFTGCSTSGAPTTTAATRRTWSPTGASRTPRSVPTEPCGDWVPMGADLTGTAFGSDRGGRLRGGGRARTGRRRDAVGGDADRPGVRDAERRRRRRRGAVPAHRHAADAGAVRDRDRDRSRQPEPRVDLLHGLQRVHAGHAGARVRGDYDPTTTRRRSRTCRTTSATSRSRRRGLRRERALFAATDFGVLELPPGPPQWIAAGGGLPHVAVYGLTSSESARCWSRRRTVVAPGR